MISATRSENGFTLLESVIALFLLTIMMLWTMQCMITAYSVSSRNQLRDEAVRIVNERLADARNIPFSNTALQETEVTLNRQIRNYSHAYAVKEVYQTIVNGTASSLTVKATWTHKGTQYSHSATTIIGDI
ncbi:PulJ/GspJ family protein [Desulfosediminicola sp.]|uniref:PulJ/GspJ family protein n=1 Tax=Desulfosediminicola sp. TaxID=2886825 RepID=UPI003AF1FA4E